jgi:putative addiction module killer protein
MVISIVQSDRFVDWMKSLRDTRARARILERLVRVSQGNLGDVAAVGDGVSELRIHYGPGYRVYFVRRGQTVILLLCGGDKSTQKRDIAAARAMAVELEN